MKPPCGTLGEVVGAILSVSLEVFGGRILNVQVPDCPRKVGLTLMVEGRLLSDTDLDVVRVTGLPLKNAEAGTVTVVFACVWLVGLDDVTVMGPVLL